MADHSGQNHRNEDDAVPRGQAQRPEEAKAPTVFNPKGIGSNVLLTTAAAIVPIVVIGVAGLKTLLGARRPRR